MTTWITRPIAPASTSSDARVVARLNLANCGKLVERRASGFVDHHVLACLHRLNGQGGAVGGNRRNQDHPDLRIVQDRAAIVDLFKIGKNLAELGFRDRRAIGPVPGTGATLCLHVGKHAEDMSVVDTENTEFERHAWTPK